MSEVAALPGPTVGAMLIGGIVGASLYGLTCSQGFMYYNRGQKDSFLMRTYVLVLWLVDSTNVLLMGHLLYDSFITHYGDPTIFDKPLWSLVTLVLFTSIVSFMVRGLYIKGIWHLSHEHPIITGALSILSVFDFVCGILLSFKGYRTKAGEISTLKVYLYLEFVSAILADASVAGTLVYLLRGTKTGNPRHASVSSAYTIHPTDPRARRTDSFGGRLMLFAVNTGLLTAADAAVALITYAAMPNNFVFLTPFMVLSHFYTNALFASLNSRTLGKPGDRVLSVNLSTVSPQRFPGSSTGTGPHGAQQLNIPIQSVVQTRVDESGSDNEDLKSAYSMAKAL
ncbi:hypothetical protein PYCCODRAFT_1463231 [Trametes coccinea BRFM310]|uniref:DUF6534 domain-containing protein n=1 Tax=Trametes coccinea (strain BRFM310) TaxID=1353009 RepID=A0A1Y2J3H9_TRAC3|nr:hypothetical protein PYCCODRAFT_1463231 [Trametes coccinea BRFM310]